MSLFTAIAQHIASLGAALPSQNARLIRLHTPLGPDALMVESVYDVNYSGRRIDSA
jgi:hypothetical protein